MFADYDFDLLINRHGDHSVSEAELTAFDPLPEDYFARTRNQPLSIADALLQFREEMAKLLKDGEQLSRFSSAYIHISGLIRNSVTLLGQGLMTLHQEGLDISSFSLSIFELRCIASFHFRKTIRGARAARETNRTVYYRCMQENLEWVKLMCRLEVSERKLQKQVKEKPASQEIIEVKSAEPAAGDLLNAGSIPAASPLQPVHALAPLSNAGKKKLILGQEKPEPKAEPDKSEPVKTAKVKPAKTIRSALGAPYTLGAFNLPQCKAPLEKMRAEMHRTHPPGKDECPV